MITNIIIGWGLMLVGFVIFLLNHNGCELFQGTTESQVKRIDFFALLIFLIGLDFIIDFI